MKIIKNAKEASCISCFMCPGAALENGAVVCGGCGSSQLIDAQGNIFQPVFDDDPEKMYQASKYTPRLPDRRKIARRVPIMRERRHGMFV